MKRSETTRQNDLTAGHGWMKRRRHEHRLYCVRCFEQVVEKKDSTAIDRFYDPSFVMSSNGITQDYESSAFGFT